MNSHLPQHSEQAFRFYEPYIAQALDNYPTPTIFHPDVPSTFIARFRDAVKSMQLNGWTSHYFTLDSAQAVFRSLRRGGDFILTAVADGIYCGPPLKDNGTIQTTRGLVIQGLESGEIDARDEPLFTSLVTIKLRGLLFQPLTFRNVSPSQLAHVADHPSLEFFEDEPGKHILI